jgi:hypothetical protein
MMKMVDDRAREIQILKSIIFFLLEDDYPKRHSPGNFLKLETEIHQEGSNKIFTYNIDVGNDKFTVLSHRFYSKDSKKKKVKKNQMRTRKRSPPQEQLTPSS